MNKTKDLFELKIGVSYWKSPGSYKPWIPGKYKKGSERL